jgi:hypothetical protein
MAKNTFSAVRGVRGSLPGSPKSIQDGRLEICLSFEEYDQIQQEP